MPSSLSLLVWTAGRERPTLRRALEDSQRHAGLLPGDEVVVANPGGDAGVAAAAEWANAIGPAAARAVALPAATQEGQGRNLLALEAGRDLLVWLDDADLFYGNGLTVLRGAADEAPGHAVLAFREARGGAKDRMALARRGRQGNWLAPAGYLQDTVARHGGLARALQAVVYLVRPFPEKW